MDKTTSRHSEVAPPGASPEGWNRLKNDSPPAHDVHVVTSVERSVRRTLFRIYLIVGSAGIICCLGILFGSLVFYRQATYVDPITPDYSVLDAESDTYWTDRIRIDLATVQQSEGSDQVRDRRLRTFVYNTVTEAMQISPPYARAQAVTGIAMVLTQHDIDLPLDYQLQQLGNTHLIVSMRARTLISQALMYLRKERSSAAQLALQQYKQLVTDADIKLNSPRNEESFFGAVTVLCYLGDTEHLRELFENQRATVAVLGIDQRMKAYRLIAGEQVRTGQVLEALETANYITNPVELARAWALILQYSARPPKVLPVEPVMLELLDTPQDEPPTYLPFAERVAGEIFQHLAAHYDLNTQTALLQRIVGSRLMFDAELRQTFRKCLVESEVLQDRVKQPVLKLLDDPLSPAIRAVLDMPPRTGPASPSLDSALDDWITSDEPIYIEVADIDSTQLRTLNDQQWVEALIAMAQSYQSIRRFQDADRILKQAFVNVQRFVDPNVRVQLLMRIGEGQVAVGSIADARRTLTIVAPELNSMQKEDLARQQILARLLDDAFPTISSMDSPANREYPCSFLIQEQIRINRLNDAKRTLSLMPQGAAASKSRSRLNIADGTATHEDYNTFGLQFSDGSNQNWESLCTGLIQQGFLRQAEQAAENIGDVQRRNDIRVRIAQEYLLLYQAFNEVNDPNDTIRQEIQQTILSLVNRTGQPVLQATILTELLMYYSGQMRVEADRAEGKRLWAQAMYACRNVVAPDDKTVLFAQLILVKNLLDNPNLLKRTMPLFTRETNAQAYEETNALINECIDLVNLQEEEDRGIPCAHLALALVQIGRTTAAQVLLDRVLLIAENLPGRKMAVPIFLSMIPALQAMHSMDTIPMVYRLAISDIAREFSGRVANVDEYEWRMRDSEIEQIIRLQLESGFVDDAVESVSHVFEPVLRDRLFRTAAYIYLDLGNVDRAELVIRRLTVREIRDRAVQNIQIIKQRSEIRPPTLASPPS